MREVLEAIVIYRDRVGPLGFQLEKLDHWISLARQALAAPPVATDGWQPITEAQIFERACQAVNYALELIGDDGYETPFHGDPRAQRIVQDVIQGELTKAYSHCRPAPPADAPQEKV